MPESESPRSARLTRSSGLSAAAVIDAVFAAACLVSRRRRFWTSPGGIALNAARIFVAGQVVALAREIDGL